MILVSSESQNLYEIKARLTRTSTRLGWEGLFGQLDGEKHQGGSLRRVARWAETYDFGVRGFGLLRSHMRALQACG